MPVCRGSGVNSVDMEVPQIVFFFRLPCPPPPQPTGILYSPQFRSKMRRPVEFNDRHLRPHGKIGDCEQSMLARTFYKAKVPFTVFVVAISASSCGGQINLRATPRFASFRDFIL